MAVHREATEAVGNFWRDVQFPKLNPRVHRRRAFRMLVFVDFVYVGIILVLLLTLSDGFEVVLARFCSCKIGGILGIRTCRTF